MKINLQFATSERIWLRCATVAPPYLDPKWCCAVTSSIYSTVHAATHNEQYLKISFGNSWQNQRKNMFSWNSTAKLFEKLKFDSLPTSASFKVHIFWEGHTNGLLRNPELYNTIIIIHLWIKVKIPKFRFMELLGHTAILK